MSELRVLLAGGGTAGHVNPLLATAAELRSRHPEARIEALGTAAGLEGELVPAAGFVLHTIPRVRLPRSISPEWLTLPFRLPLAFLQTASVLKELDPHVVVGFGGDLSAPACRLAVARGIPLVIHEQNARPGLVNRWAAARAQAVAVTFPSTPLEAPAGRRRVTGLPLRAPVAELVAERDRGAGQEARRRAAAALGLDPALPTLLVTGGSLGAMSLNNAASGAAAALTSCGQVLHLTGKGRSGGVREAVAALDSARQERYQVLEYLEEMELGYAVADLALTRAGAGMVSELSALGIPAIYVPFAVGNGEQRFNAADVVAAGGGILLDDKDLDAAYVAGAVAELLADGARRETMAAAGSTPTDGAARLADIIEEVGGRK